MRFATDASLGKLGRLLRTAGFDTRCQHQCRQHDFWCVLEPDRIAVTRTHALRKCLREHPVIFIRHNDPMAQLGQVVAEVDIGPDDVQIFSRCLSCNTVIRRIDRQAVKGLVPAYVWHRRQYFHICDTCKRIYWAGSHHDRASRRFDLIFQHKDAMHT